MNKKIIAIILARGGSKGIHKKNLANLNGKPLLYYTISEAKKSTFITDIVLSSDNDEIISYAESQHIPTIKRPKDLSLDRSTSEESLYDAVKKSISIGLKFDYILLLQPTSPFRTATHINEAIKKIILEKNMNCLVSICKSEVNPYLLKIIDSSGFLSPLINNLPKIKYPNSRQSASNNYYLNGAIYLVKKEYFLNKVSFYDKQTGYYLMDKISSIDIDEPLDLEFANYLLQKGIECRK